MNKKNLALVLGLMVNLAPVCCADEAQALQEPTTQVCTENACPVTDVTPASEVIPAVEPEQAPEVTPAPVATDVQPEQEMTEEQFKKLLDQIIEEAKKEEEARKAQQAQAPVAA